VDVKAGEGGFLFEDFRQSNSIAIGWKDIGDLTKVESKEGVRERYLSQWPTVKPAKAYGAGSDAPPATGELMNFLVDAQLPRRMRGWQSAAGNDAKHTIDLADQNRSTDEQINDVADQEQRVVVTKDADFVDSHLLSSRPEKLLLISTGNISNRELEGLMVPLLPNIMQEFQSHSFLELGRSGIDVRS
jgi:predicted nuclease of predicted toxin-antitoxin system